LSKCLGASAEERGTKSLAEVLIEAVEMARFVVEEVAIAWKELEKSGSEGRIDTRLRTSCRKLVVVDRLSSDL
jgi:hypothetical protein